MNMIKKYTGRSLWLAGLMLTTLIAGCSGGGSSSVATDPAATGDAPTVVETAPADKATAVPPNSKVTVTFSEEMDKESFTDASFTVIDADRNASLVGDVSYDAVSKTATFTPSINFTISTTHIATVTTAVTSIDGTPLAADYVWSFTSGTTADIDNTDPTVTSTNTFDGFPLNRDVTATFSEKLDPTTVNSSTFKLATGTTAVEGTVTYSNMMTIFNPTDDLLADTLYTATLTTGITDLAGNTLAVKKDWSFTTGATLDQLPVELGAAGDFVILSKKSITNVPTSAITGDIGLSPAAASFIGLSCTEVSGTIYGVDETYTGTCYQKDDALLTTAVSNMETAYTDAAGRTLPDFTELHAGDLSGKTLVPGLYKWGTDVLINDNVTLAGGPNDVWIFQIDGNVTQATSTQVILDGASAKNVFWQVAGGAGVTIGTYADFQGVVLAQTAVTVTTGATVNGRLFAQTDVILQKNEVTEPAL